MEDYERTIRFISTSNQRVGSLVTIFLMVIMVRVQFSSVNSVKTSYTLDVIQRMILYLHRSWYLQCMVVLNIKMEYGTWKTELHMKINQAQMA